MRIYICLTYKSNIASLDPSLNNYQHTVATRVTWQPGASLYTTEAGKGTQSD
jgi:hypothetical protein